MESFIELYPTITDGVEGINFLYRSIESSQREGEWVDFTYPLETSIFDATTVPAIPSYESLNVHPIPVPVVVSPEESVGVSVAMNPKHIGPS